MKFAIFLIMRRVAIGCVWTGTLAAIACADGPTVPTSPSASAAAESLSKSSPRSGELHVTKNCDDYTGQAGDFCTITSSNLKQIEAGSRVIYASAAVAGSLDGRVVLDLPGPGNNTAFGHCQLNLGTGVGLCTFSGGTGKFTHFHADDLRVSNVGELNFAWNGTYSFSPND